MALGGNEVSGDITPVQPSIVGQIVGVRHSHLDNAGYSIDQKAAKKRCHRSRWWDEIIKEDNFRGVFTAWLACLFRFAASYTNENIIDALGAVGIEKTVDDWHDLGQEDLQMKVQWFKTREAYSTLQSKHPKSGFYETVSTLGKVDSQTVRRDAAPLQKEERMALGSNPIC